MPIWQVLTRFWYAEKYFSLWEDKTEYFFSKEHMNDKNIIKAVEQQQQEEENEKIRKFIKAKKRLTQRMKEKEAEARR